jgi:Right handed beta helix region
MTIDRTLPTELGYISQRAGNVLYIENQSQIPADITPYSVIRIKRGAELVWDMPILSGKDYLCYGDENAPKPIIRKSGDNVVVESNGKSDVLLADLDLRGGKRCLSFYGGGNIKVVRCHLADTSAYNISAGVYTKYVNGLYISQCTASGINGDVVYCTGTQNAKLQYNDFGSVNGGQADGIQFTGEGKSGQRCSGVLIENNVIRTDSLSTSGKGAIAIEETDNFVVRYNDVEGQFFGIGVGGGDGEVYKNNVWGTSSDFQYGYGIGIGVKADGIQIQKNNISNCPRGIVVSGSNPAAVVAADRANLDIRFNVIDGCPIPVHVDVPYTGVISNNG